MTLVSLDGVSVRYGHGPDVLDHVTLRIGQGDFVGIVGPSGAGKTTLLKVILGTVPASHGRVERGEGLRIGYVPQVETINWHFPVTVFEAVLMSSRSGRRWPWSTSREADAVHDVLDRLGIGGLADRHIRQLSGGQQQRVFIARALFSEPQILLMDEPTSGVDVRTRHEILHLLEELHHGGLCVVVSTHDLNGIAAHLPTLVCVNGRVTGYGSPAQVLTPEVLEATYGAPMDVLLHAGMPLVVDRRTLRPIGRSARSDRIGEAS